MQDLSYGYLFAFIIGLLAGWRVYALLMVFIFRIMKRTAPLFTRREGTLYGVLLLAAGVTAAATQFFLAMSPVFRLSVCFVASIFVGFAIHLLRVCLRRVSQA